MATIQKFPVFRLLPSVSSKNVISALEPIILECGSVEEIISDNGKQKVWNNPTSSHQTSLQQCSSLSKRQEYAGCDTHANELPPLLPQQPVWAQKSHCQPMVTIHSDTHQVRTLPIHIWYPCQMVPNTSITGWCYDEEWWKVASATKGNQC